jgi:putative transposase
MRSGWTRYVCAARSGIWIASTAPAHPSASTKMASTPLVAVCGSVRPPSSRPRSGWPSCIVAWPSTAERCNGALGNRLLGHGADIACERLNYVSWQKNFPRSVRDRAPGLLVEMMRRKAGSAGGGRLYEYNPRTTALSQTCLCGNREKKPLSQRVHRCECGTTEDRDLFSAYLGLHVRTQADGVDRLDLQPANQGWLHRQDVDESPKSSRSALARKRRGRRHPPSRRSVARIKARRKANTVMRQSRSARTSTTDQPTAIAA